MKKAMILFTAAFFTVSAFAQQADFSGHWMFASEKIITGKLYPGASPKRMNIRQRAQFLANQKIEMNSLGENMPINDTLYFDGQPFETQTREQRKKTIVMRWAPDRKSFSDTIKIYSFTDTNKVVSQFTENFLMKGDNLVYTRMNENFDQGETWQIQATYGKL